MKKRATDRQLHFLKISSMIAWAMVASLWGKMLAMFWNSCISNIMHACCCPDACALIRVGEIMQCQGPTRASQHKLRSVYARSRLLVQAPCWRSPSRLWWMRKYAPTGGKGRNVSAQQMNDQAGTLQDMTVQWHWKVELDVVFPEGMRCLFPRLWQPIICCGVWITSNFASNFVQVNEYLLP